MPQSLALNGFVKTAFIEQKKTGNKRDLTLDEGKKRHADPLT